MKTGFAVHFTGSATRFLMQIGGGGKRMTHEFNPQTDEAQAQ
jgi:hypothetical protein